MISAKFGSVNPLYGVITHLPGVFTRISLGPISSKARAPIT